MTTLSQTVLADLKRALKRDPIPHGLRVDIADALDRYRQRGDRHAASKRWEAVKRVERAALELEDAMRDADVAFGRAGFWRKQDRSLRELRQSLLLWCESRKPSPRRRGRPDDGRRDLREAVFASFDQHGIALTRASRGPAAQALAVVLAEADRLDGKQHVNDGPRPANRRFSGELWGAWVAEHEAFDRLFQDWEEADYSRSWLRHNLQGK